MTSTKDRRGTVDWSSFPDTGCDESPSCLTCPLAVCKHDHAAVAEWVFAA